MLIRKAKSYQLYNLHTSNLVTMTIYTLYFDHELLSNSLLERVLEKELKPFSNKTYKKLSFISLKRTWNETHSPKVDVGTCVSNTYWRINLCNIIKVYFIKLRKEWAIRVAVEPFTEIALAMSQVCDVITVGTDIGECFEQRVW